MLLSTPFYQKMCTSQFYFEQNKSDNHMSKYFRTPMLVDKMNKNVTLKNVDHQIHTIQIPFEQNKSDDLCQCIVSISKIFVHD